MDKEKVRAAKGRAGGDGSRGAGSAGVLQANGAIPAPFPVPAPAPQLPPRSSRRRLRRQPRSSREHGGGTKAEIKPGRAGGDGVGWSWANVSTSPVARANCSAKSFVTRAGAFAAVKYPGNTFLRRSRDRQEEQGEASHLCRQIREMPESRETGCPATQPHRNLSVLCVKKGFVQRSKSTEESTN